MLKKCIIPICILTAVRDAKLGFPTTQTGGLGNLKIRYNSNFSGAFRKADGPRSSLAQQGEIDCARKVVL